jgi:hypothetical protein
MDRTYSWEPSTERKNFHLFSEKIINSIRNVRLYTQNIPISFIIIFLVAYFCISEMIEVVCEAEERSATGLQGRPSGGTNRGDGF